MDFTFFKPALKYNASLTILSVVILYLLKPMFENIEFISNNPIVTLVFFIIAINALVLALFYTSKQKNAQPTPAPAVIQDNEIIGNKAKNINITTDGNVTGNKINNNEADGDFNVGQGFKNGEK